MKGWRTSRYTMGPSKGGGNRTLIYGFGDRHSTVELRQCPQLNRQPPTFNHTLIIDQCQEHSLENPKSLWRKHLRRTRPAEFVLSRYIATSYGG